jgi:low temperature requirement protein LtrA
MKRNLLTMFGAFVLASALAGALGAVNLGTALAFGQMAFAASTVYVILRRSDDPVAAAAGAFATQIGLLGSEEAKRLDREEEQDAQERDRH